MIASILICQGLLATRMLGVLKALSGTIMSYKSPAVMYFNTPALTNQCANGPCGYAETDAAGSSDQVKSVNLTGSNIVSFMPTIMTAPVIK